MQIKSLKIFRDNYIWLLIRANSVIVIDPGSADIVMNYIIDNHLQLQAILLTHEHSDHVDGVVPLTTKYNVPVYGLGKYATQQVGHKEQLKLDGFPDIEVIYTPGHTQLSLSYLIKTDPGHLFCGDTLFAAGVGRVFSKNYEAMYNSLRAIASLPDATMIYPAHEYTVANLKFALSILPNDVEIVKRLAFEAPKDITLPTNLALELKTNLFLRSNDYSLCTELSSRCSIKVSPGLDCFTRLRQLKDNF